MSGYSRYERELIELLEDNGFVAMRAPASGGATDRDLPDIIAMRPHATTIGTDVWVFEVKYRSKTPAYASIEEGDALMRFARDSGATPAFAFRWNANKSEFHGDTNWYLKHPNSGEMKETTTRFDYEDMDTTALETLEVDD